MNNNVCINLNQSVRTTRLQLIPQISLHAKEMFNVLNDPSLYEFTGGNPPSSEESLETRFKQLESRTSPDGTVCWLNWVIQNENLDLIGYVQATVSSHEASIAWVIGSKWQKSGYASEASFALVEWLKKNQARHIRAYINPRHQASQAVAKKVGMTCKAEIVDGEEVWELVAM